MYFSRKVLQETQHWPHMALPMQITCAYFNVSIDNSRNFQNVRRHTVIILSVDVY